MRWFYVILFSLVGFTSVAQTPIPVKGDWWYDGIRGIQKMTIPGDTLPAALNRSIAIASDGCLYAKVGGSWKKVWCDTTAVASTLAISVQPTSRTINAGQNTTFTVTATGGSTPYTYQWQKFTTDKPGATSINYTISSAIAGDSGNYRVLITDAALNTVTSSYAHLTVLVPALSISTQPINQTVAEGGNTGFTVALSGGTTPYTYQWKFNGSNISGATSSTYNIIGVTSGQAGNYSVVGSDAASGSITSSTATLTVTAPAPSVVFGYSATNPWTDNSTAPTISSPTTISITSGADVVFSLPSGAADKYWVVKVPIAEPVASNWYHNTDNSGPIPGDVVRTWTVGSFRYYSSVSEFVLTYTDSIQLRH